MVFAFFYSSFTMLTKCYPQRPSQHSYSILQHFVICILFCKSVWSLENWSASRKINSSKLSIHSNPKLYPPKHWQSNFTSLLMRMSCGTVSKALPNLIILYIPFIHWTIYLIKDGDRIGMDWQVCIFHLFDVHGFENPWMLALPPLRAHLDPPTWSELSSATHDHPQPPWTSEWPLGSPQKSHFRISGKNRTEVFMPL